MPLHIKDPATEAPLRRHGTRLIYKASDFAQTDLA
jgi:uncharacterized protein with PIN domain